MSFAHKLKFDKRWNFLQKSGQGVAPAGSTCSAQIGEKQHNPSNKRRISPPRLPSRVSNKKLTLSKGGLSLVNRLSLSK